ncbi:hypothetical protein HID58_034743, partial [Brassica napus]
IAGLFLDVLPPCNHLLQPPEILFSLHRSLLTPDPFSPLSPHLFPPLAFCPPPSRSEIRRSHLISPLADTVMTQALDCLQLYPFLQLQLRNPNPLNPFLTSSSSLLQEHRVPSPIETSS